jgi:hypothetical protein
MDILNSRIIEHSIEAKKKLLTQLSDPFSCQEGVLKRCIALNKKSSFGQEHRFDHIDSIADFQRYVPIRTYDEYYLWIKRVETGENHVLTDENPVLFFTSSGSTGDFKKIPVTTLFLKECYLPFVYASMGNFFEYYPNIMYGKDTTINFKWDPFVNQKLTPTGKLHVGASQVNWSKMIGDDLAVEPGMRAPWATPPHGLTNHMDRIYYRIRLAAEYNIQAIVGINPSVINALPELVNRWSERLIREIYNGTILNNRFNDGNPQRAKELEAISSYFGSLFPYFIWPHLQVIYCWTGGIARLYLNNIKNFYGPNVDVLAAPIAASEGPVGIPIDHHPTSGVLSLPFAFLEFIEAREVIKNNSKTILFNELKVGGEYHVILTQIGGFYRYIVGDIIRVVDLYQHIPLVEYVGRNKISSIANEELREFHVVDALNRTLYEAGFKISNVSCKIIDKRPPYYEYALEFSDGYKTNYLQKIADLLDNHLCQLSEGYNNARSQNKLAKVMIVPIEHGSFVDDWISRLEKGIRPAQAKDRLFETDSKRWNRLLGKLN